MGIVGITAMTAMATMGVQKMVLDHTKKKLAEKAVEKIKNMGNTEDDFRTGLGRMTDDELASVYIPDVYQKDIYMVDYEKWKTQGIKLISFDIDDIIADFGAGEAPQTVLVFFKDLKRMGFTVALLTNSGDSEGKNFAQKWGADYVVEAKKPYCTGLLTVLLDYEKWYHETLGRTQMAHVGSDLCKDIKDGNIFGITTCLVRRGGKWGRAGAGIKKMLGVNENHIVREELKNRGLWYAHHQKVKADQYYQFGEAPGYRKGAMHGTDIGKQAEDDFNRKLNEMEEVFRYGYKHRESEEKETLRTHLGKDIVFTGTWNGTGDMRRLEESELCEGEVYAFISTVGCYSVRQALCLYKDSDGTDYTERKPAGKDVINAYKRKDDVIERRYRDAFQISAKYNGGNGNGCGEWIHVCFADVSLFWAELIGFICTVKSEALSSDSQDFLFVLKTYAGGDYDVAHWYMFIPDGKKNILYMTWMKTKKPLGI